jgi:hypothetical protein
MLWRVVASYT